MLEEGQSSLAVAESAFQLRGGDGASVSCTLVGVGGVEAAADMLECVARELSERQTAAELAAITGEENAALHALYGMRGCGSGSRVMSGWRSGRILREVALTWC